MDDFTLWEREMRRESGIQALLTQLDAVEAEVFARAEDEWCEYFEEEGY